MSTTRILKKLCKKYLDYLILDNELQEKIRSLIKGDCLEVHKDAREFNNKLRRSYKLHFIAKAVQTDKVEDGKSSLVVISAKRFPTIYNYFYFFSGNSFFQKE